MTYLHKSILAAAATAISISAAHSQGMPLQTLETVQFGFPVFGYEYQETVNGAEFMNTKGNKVGLSFNYTGVWGNGRFAGLDLRYSTGQIAYSGSGNSTSRENSVDLRLTGGVDFPMNNFTLSPFAGVGHRSLHSDLTGLSTTGLQGYRRDSTYVYLPIGVTHRFKAGTGRISTTLEYDHLIQGTQISALSAVGASGDLNNTQRNGRGLRLGVAYEETHWSASVFYNTWDIERSDDATFVSGGFLYTGYEPQNTTKELGFEVKYKF